MADADGKIVTGRVASGQGEGARFTQLAWARAAFVAELGIDPFPGTLNLAPDDRAAWRAQRTRPGIVIKAPDPSWCDARAYKVRVAGRIAGAVVVPEIAGYPEDKIEIIAAESLRGALGLRDGDLVAVEFS
jgi:CTP-dependent riboflavin kinase